MRSDATRALERLFGSTVARARALGGGCINDAWMVSLGSGVEVFVKTHDSPPAGMFLREAEGLRALSAPAEIRVPDVLGVDDHYLILESIQSGSRNRDFGRTLGHQLARLHRAASAARPGFSGDNFIGSTPQPNRECESWIQFFVEQRIQFQLGLARDCGLTDRRFDELGDRFLLALPSRLEEPDQNSLIHGDLWSGNVMADAVGRPVLIDPAAYYGHREAELGMTVLFGGFDSQFYDAYHESWPLSPGWRERVEIYSLYHLLNHLNLFGGSYRSSCQALMERFA